MKQFLFITLVLCSCSNSNVETTTIEKEIADKELNGNSELAKEKEKKLEEPNFIEFKSKHTFDKYNVKKYNGKITLPNFKNNPFGNDAEYVEFIRQGCKENGINFGGHYTIITRSCGMECSHLFIIDRINGEVFTEINLNEGKFGFEFNANSTMLIANSSLFKDQDFNFYEKHDHWKPELYKWEKDKFEKIK